MLLRDPDLCIMLVILPDRSGYILPSDPISIQELLQSFGYNPTTVIVIRNGAIVPEDFTAAGDDLIRIVSVSHGG